MKKFLALFFFVSLLVLTALSVVMTVDVEAADRPISSVMPNRSGQGCNGRDAGAAGTPLEGRLDDACSGDAFRNVRGAKNFQGRVNSSMDQMINKVNEKLVEAETFVPTSDVEDAKANWRPKTRIPVSVQEQPDQYTAPEEASGQDAPEGYVPPMYDPGNPCTWPAEVRESAKNPGGCADYADKETRDMCEQLQKTPVDCSGYSDPGVPGSCAAMGMYKVNDICVCDNPDTNEVEPCPAYSACAASGQYLTPDNRCIDDCSSEGLVYGAGMTCIANFCGAGYWDGSDDRTCRCFPSATLVNGVCQCPQFTQPDMALAQCKRLETCMTADFCSSIIDVSGGRIRGNYDGCNCSCEESGSGAPIDCGEAKKLPPGSTCPSDSNLFIQDNGVDCGCNNPTTPRDECYSGTPACEEACSTIYDQWGDGGWENCVRECDSDKCSSQVKSSFPECDTPPPPPPGDCGYGYYFSWTNEGGNEDGYCVCYEGAITDGSGKCVCRAGKTWDNAQSKCVAPPPPPPPAGDCGYGTLGNAYCGDMLLDGGSCTCFGGAVLTGAVESGCGQKTGGTCVCPDGKSWDAGQNKCVAPFIGQPGDVCPNDSNLFVQNDRLTCGCNNPTTPANECRDHIGFCDNGEIIDGNCVPCDNPRTRPIEMCR